MTSVNNIQPRGLGTIIGSDTFGYSWRCDQNIMHISKKRHTVKCIKCNKMFYDDMAREQHIKDVHTNLPMFLCRVKDCDLY